MYIINASPGFKKMLWPAAQKFLDAKTIGKIQVRDLTFGWRYFICPLPEVLLIIHFSLKFQVLEPKSLCKLLDTIDTGYASMTSAALACLFLFFGLLFTL